MKTIATFNNIGQADAVKARMEAAGIKAFLTDEAQVTSGYGSVVGPIRLQVNVADEEMPERILSSGPSVVLPEDFNGSDKSAGSAIDDRTDLGTVHESIER